MITRTIAGLPFEIESPSFYRLDPSLTRGVVIDISFLGTVPLPADAAPAECWCLFFGKPDGSVLTRMFDNRDQAIEFLLPAFGLTAPPIPL